MRQLVFLVLTTLLCGAAFADDRAELARVQPFLAALQADERSQRLFVVGNMTPEMVLSTGVDRVAERMAVIANRLGDFQHLETDISGSQVFVRLRPGSGGEAQLVLMLGPAPHYQLASFELRSEPVAAAPRTEPTLPTPSEPTLPTPSEPTLPTPSEPTPSAEAPDAHEVPEELVQRRLVPFLEALSAPVDERRRFVEANMTDGYKQRIGVDELVATMGRLSQEFGAFRVYAVSRQSGELLAHVDLLDDGFRTVLALAIGPAPGYLIDGLSLTPVEIPDEALPQVTAESLTDELSRFVTEYAAQTGFIGTVLVARGDEMAYAGAFGPADPDGIEANTLLMPFNVGSVTELFTAVVALSLAEDEVFDLRETIDTYLPDWPDETFRNAQIGDLLTQVSGLAPFPTERVHAMRDRLDGVSDWLELARTTPMLTEPGVSFARSGANAVVLAAIAERATGRPYLELVRERVYERAGMGGASHPRRDEIEGCCAIGILDDGGDYIERQPRRGSPAAGSYATAVDLWRFSTALLQGRLLSTNTYLRATSPGLVPHPGFAQGLGFTLYDFDGEMFLGASDRGPGFSADFAVYPATGHTVVVLSNTDGAARPLAMTLRRILRPLVSE